MIFILAQTIGLIAFIINLIAYYKKDKEQILGGTIISNSLNFFHYILLEAYSGCVIKIIAIARDSIIVLKKKHKFLSTNFILYILIIIYVILGIITYKSFISLFPIISAMVYTIPLWNGNTRTTRLAAIISRVFWLIYNISVLSISGILSDTIFMISTYIAFQKNKKVLKEDKNDNIKSK